VITETVLKKLQAATEVISILARCGGIACVLAEYTVLIPYTWWLAARSPMARPPFHSMRDAFSDDDTVKIAVDYMSSLAIYSFWLCLCMIAVRPRDPKSYGIAIVCFLGVFLPALFHAMLID
jgi:hypothetical protein